MPLREKIIRQETQVLSSLVIRLIRLYQKYLAPSLLPSCRFYPSCSDYIIEAIGYFGIARGIFKGLLRVARCNPIFAGGYDPITKGQNDPFDTSTTLSVVRSVVSLSNHCAQGHPERLKGVEG